MAEAMWDPRRVLAGAESTIEDARAEFDARIEKLAERVRETLVLPVCRKHKLTYMAGMGRCVFYPLDTRKGAYGLSTSYGCADDAKGRKCYADLTAVFKVLDLETEYMQVLGYFVAGVKRGDL